MPANLDEARFKAVPHVDIDQSNLRGDANCWPTHDTLPAAGNRVASEPMNPEETPQFNR